MNMKTILAVCTSLVFVGSVSAATDAEIYHGFADGNPDLSTDIKADDAWPTGVQPGVGDRFDLYHGLSDNNPDLYPSVGEQSLMAGMRTGGAPEFGDSHVYHGFEVGNPDL